MRRSIRRLFPKRQQVRHMLEQLNVVLDWMKTIGTYASFAIQIEYVITEA